MNVSIAEPWQQFIDGLVQAGRYGSASEVFVEGLRLIQQEEAKLAALRETIEAAIAGGGAYTDEEVAASLEEAGAKLVAEGY